ncbi:hypothetical protein LZ32DRAFT_264930 [Colletotrichum eremochloae]|nr:hypothetical protein LZ32DRAFT_264930 [Colletotrichum eremochloae]
MAFHIPSITNAVLNGTIFSSLLFALIFRFNTMVGTYTMYFLPPFRLRALAWVNPRGDWPRLYLCSPSARFLLYAIMSSFFSLSLSLSYTLAHTCTLLPPLNLFSPWRRDACRAGTRPVRFMLLGSGATDLTPLPY